MKTREELIMAARNRKIKEQEEKWAVREKQAKRKSIQDIVFEKMGMRIKVNKP